MVNFLKQILQFLLRRSDFTPSTQPTVAICSLLKSTLSTLGGIKSILSRGKSLCPFGNWNLPVGKSKFFVSQNLLSFIFWYSLWLVTRKSGESPRFGENHTDCVSASSPCKLESVSIYLHFSRVAQYLCSLVNVFSRLFSLPVVLSPIFPCILNICLSSALK